jgi:hypothetical protein
VSRLGQRTFDLHHGTFDIDETALDVGVRYTVTLAQVALERLGAAATRPASGTDAPATR